MMSTNLPPITGKSYDHALAEAIVHYGENWYRLCTIKQYHYSHGRKGTGYLVSTLPPKQARLTG